MRDKERMYCIMFSLLSVQNCTKKHWREIERMILCCINVVNAEENIGHICPYGSYGVNSV